MNRRELLRLLSIAGTLVGFPQTAMAETAAKVDAAGEVEQFALLNAHLWQVFVLSKSKRLVYPLARDQLGMLIGRMEKARSTAVHEGMCVLACELFQLAGESLFDGNRYTDAAYCYGLAASAGREARAYDQWACALTRQAFINMYDQQFAQAATILAAASRVAGRGDSQLSTRHRVAAAQAQAHAGLGDLDTCNRALDEADKVLNLTGSVNPGGWLRFDGSRLAEERGGCYLYLGRADLAGTALTEALGQTVSMRRQGSILTDMAMLGVQRNDLDQVLHHADQATILAERTQSAGYVGRKLQSLRLQLTPFLKDARVDDLNLRITRLSGSV
ncbi:transcriptional regulator [Streptosporangium algeriense]|uniref:Transcriptional regulator n=1 Tax=Streptosporangium algeriense TaxID=1682748 RepID=A0ABW3DKF8_9ACTN